jgi:hypothetical protein
MSIDGGLSSCGQLSFSIWHTTVCLRSPLSTLPDGISSRPLMTCRKRISCHGRLAHPEA